MATYSALTDSLIARIEKDYGLTIDGAEPIPYGQCNSNFRLDTDRGRFILTIVEELSMEEMNRVTGLLVWLQDHGMNTVQAAKRLDQQVLGEHDGKPFYMKGYIEGKVPDHVGAELMKQIGTALAELHSIEPPTFLQNRMYFEEERFRDFIGSGKDEEYESWLAERLKLEEEISRMKLPVGLIHGDVFVDNVLVEGKEVRAIIDFEEACLGEFVFDLGMTMIGMCSPGNRLDFDLSAAFVEGYLEKRILSPEEKEALQDCIVYAAAGVSSWRYWKFKLQKMEASKEDHFRNLVELAENVRNVPKVEFVQKIFG